MYPPGVNAMYLMWCLNLLDNRLDKLIVVSMQDILLNGCGVNAMYLRGVKIT
jgi:hypothetical protein